MSASAHDDKRDEVRDCCCADPENCTQAVPGYRCRRETLNAFTPSHVARNAMAVQGCEPIKSPANVLIDTYAEDAGRALADGVNKAEIEIRRAASAPSTTPQKRDYRNCAAGTCQNTDGCIVTGCRSALYLAQSALRRWTDLYAKLQNESGEVVSRKLDYNLPPADHVKALEAIDDALACVPPATPHKTGWAIQHVDGRWRTMDTIGMPDWTDDPAKALVCRLREHTDAYATDDPEDVRIVEVSW